MRGRPWKTPKMERREAFMQDAFDGGWAQESHLSIETLESLRDLNHQFLNLTASGAMGWAVRGEGRRPLSLATQLAPLSEAQRTAAAGCPYALFDLRFQDDGHWLSCLNDGASRHIADAAVIEDDAVRFVRLALFYAWHVASSAGLAAQLLLGMNAATAARFRGVTVNQLAALAATEAENLSPRWSDCTAYWSALIGAASRTDRAGLRRVQLYGLQLAAAARLPGH
jgi:hypothetical protein